MTETPRTPRFAAAVVEHIAPVAGWTLLVIREHGFYAHDEYFVRSAAEDRVFDVSRGGFTPTQERFAWLAENGFPGPVVRPGGCMTPWCDDDIDAAIFDARLVSWVKADAAVELAA